jgi:hypothetical protein
LELGGVLVLIEMLKCNITPHMQMQIRIFQTIELNRSKLIYLINPRLDLYQALHIIVSLTLIPKESPNHSLLVKKTSETRLRNALLTFVKFKGS